MYHVLVHSLAERLAAQLRADDLLRAGDRVGVAVSGGIDSVALLHLMLELQPEVGFVLSVVHFNHNLRGEDSEADQQFVTDLAAAHGFELYCESGNVFELAAQRGSGLEAAARELRYAFFRRLLGAEGQGQPSLDKIATGHTLDDQAETVLMRLVRGTGLRGLGGIYPRILVERENDREYGEIIRPLLNVRRSELEKYLASIKQPWREDLTNADARFTRNRVRKLLLPLLESEFNPAVVESLAELAEIARDEEEFWDNEVSGWMGTVVQWPQANKSDEIPGPENTQSLVQIRATGDSPTESEASVRIQPPSSHLEGASVSLPWLLTEPKAIQRRVLRAIGEEFEIPLEFKHIEAILRFASESKPCGKELSLPLGWNIVHDSEALVFKPPAFGISERIDDYEYSLAVPGRVVVSELEVVIEALRLAPKAVLAEYNPQQLLRADLLPERLIVRNWRPGDRFWPAHTKAPKKVKELLQRQHVVEAERRGWPVVLCGDELIWMRGFPVPATLCAEAEQGGVLIREMPLVEEHGL